MNPGEFLSQTDPASDAGTPDATPQDPHPDAQQAANAQKAAKTLDEVREAHAQVRRLVEVIEADGRYPVEAFRFLQEGLDHAVKRVHGERAGIKERRDRKRQRPKQPKQSKRPEQPTPKADEHRDHPHHVDGRQLCEGLRELAGRRWGLMARTVLAHWNVHNTLDFGEMVFVLVDNGFLQKTDRDRREDFADVYPMADLEREYAIEPSRN